MNSFTTTVKFAGATLIFSILAVVFPLFNPAQGLVLTLPVHTMVTNLNRVVPVPGKMGLGPDRGPYPPQPVCSKGPGWKNA